MSQVAPNFKIAGAPLGSLQRSLRFLAGGEGALLTKNSTPLSRASKLRFPPCDFRPPRENKFGLTPLVHPQVKFLATPLSRSAR